MIINENSLMTFGKYKGTPVKDVPARYLLWLHEKRIWTRDLRIYIEDHLEQLQEQAYNMHQ